MWRRWSLLWKSMTRLMKKLSGLQNGTCHISLCEEMEWFWCLLHWGHHEDIFHLLYGPTVRNYNRHKTPFGLTIIGKPLHQRFSTNSVCWSLKRKHWQQRFFKWFCRLKPGKGWECELCDSKSWVFLDSQCQHEFFKDPLTEGMVLQTLSIDPCYTIWKMAFWMQLFISAVNLDHS